MAFAAKSGTRTELHDRCCPGFEGVLDDPCEEPHDPDLVLDTSAMTRDEAVSAVLKLLVTGGWLAGAGNEPSGTPPQGTASPSIRLGPTIRRL